MFIKLLRFIWMHSVLIVCLFVYMLLAGKNPFSERNLIGNLDPYPDTFYYSLPAWNLVHGKGFVMSDGIVSAVMAVPPAYPIYLVPFFVIFNDVRAFYFGNMLLTFGTIIIFYLILRKMYGRTMLLVLPMLLLVTNQYFYIVPSLLMAENPSIFIATLLLYLSLDRKRKSIVYFGLFLSVVLFLVKFSNFPVFISFFIVFLYKLVKSVKIKINIIVPIFLIFSAVLILFLPKFIQFVAKLPDFKLFSVSNVQNNINFYLGSIVGSCTSYLWWKNPVWPTFVGVLLLIGLFISLFKYSQNTLAARVVSIVMVTLLGYMSFFYFHDFRYVQVLIPMLLVFVLVPIFFFKNIKFKYVLVSVFCAFYIFSNKNMSAWRLQAAVNLKYREDPWQYFAIKKLNNYFEKFDTKSEVYTFLPRYLVYYFGNQKYTYNRISPDERFETNIDPIKNIYTDLELGKQVFVTNAYIFNDYANSEKWWKKVKDNFTLGKVVDGCLGSCNIYVLRVKL